MKESKTTYKVQYSDTDAYKVAWHGSYLRWMEADRVELLRNNGIDIKEYDEKFGIVMPVVEINIKYKQSAKLLDEVTVSSKIINVTNPYVTFSQIITNQEGKVLVSAEVKGVAVKNGRVMRNMEEILSGEAYGIFA